ncbi:MAG: hypothetical protein QQN41_01395 [Nitrosopumilus sp.]
MKIRADEKDAKKYIGMNAVCSKGIEGTITGIKILSCGLSFVGLTRGRVKWSSQNPTLIDDEYLENEKRVNNAK